MFSISKIIYIIYIIYFCEKMKGRFFFLRNLPSAFQSGCGEGASDAVWSDEGKFRHRYLESPWLCSPDSCGEREWRSWEPQHLSCHTWCTLGFLDWEGCDAAVAFSVRSWMALCEQRACRGEQPVPQEWLQSSLRTCQHWDHTEELLEPTRAFTNQRN